MRGSLDALLTNIIDYAGLFPPASLALDESVRNYTRYRRDPEAWMLGRFVCPAARLKELEPYLRLPGKAPERRGDPAAQLGTPDATTGWAISALGTGAETRAAFAQNLDQDAAAVADFRKNHPAESPGAAPDVGAFEVRLPAAVIRGANQTAVLDLVRLAAERFAAIGSPALPLFFELGHTGSKPVPRWQSDLEAVVAGLARYNAEHPRSRFLRRWGPAGFKLRMGGSEAAAFPTAEQVQATITACRDARVPLKFTAGLHHPIRGQRLETAGSASTRASGTGATRMHGFLNIFVAGVLAYAHLLDPGPLQEILEDEQARNFHFDDDFLGWKELDASVGEVRFARCEALISFGSCSFDEPRQGLRALGLLDGRTGQAQR